MPNQPEDFYCSYCSSEFNFNGKDATCEVCGARATYDLLDKTERITMMRDLD